MDTSKVRLFAGIGGAIFGAAGIVALMIAAVIALASVIGFGWATFTMAMIFLAIGCLCAFVFLKPYKTATEEISQFEEATADALADLPFDTFMSMIEKRPLTVSVLALFIGYSIYKNPGQASNTFQKAILSIM